MFSPVVDIFDDRMISDPASSRFISWTELGTSFVVSNVGEFSRSILGSHFKHNNVSASKHNLELSLKNIFS
jgi:hypothetical protein